MERSHDWGWPWPFGILVASASPFIAWTDGRNKRDAEDANLDLYGSRIKSGVTCP